MSNTEAQQPQPSKPDIVKQAAQVILNVDKVDEIAEYVAAIQAPNLHRNGYNTSAPFLVVPDGLKVLDLENHLPHPSRTRKNVKFTEAESFISYINEFKVGHVPQLFVKKTATGMSMKCILDYDHAGKVIENGEQLGIPQWGSHIAQLDLTYSLDYAELREKNDSWHGQEDFALFVEENTHLFKEPTGADMFELAQDLKVTISSHLKSQRRLANGQVQLEYVENVHGASASSDRAINIPTKLVLNCAIFEGLEPVDLTAAFRFRKHNNSVLFQYKLMTKLQEREAYEAIRNKVAAETTLNPLSVSSFDVKQ